MQGHSHSHGGGGQCDGHGHGSHGASAGHSHGHGDEAQPRMTAPEPQEDLQLIVWGGELPGCTSVAERARVIEAAATPKIEDVVGKTRELWRLAKLLLGPGQNSDPLALHLLAKAIEIGTRWIKAAEGAKFWGETIYNRFFRMPSVDKLDLAVYASWAHYWIIRVCATTLKRQQEADIPRDMLQKRMDEIKKLQKNYVALIKKAANNDELSKLPSRKSQVAVLWLSLSFHYANLRESKEDERFAKLAVECDPRNAEARLRMAVSLLEKKLYVQASEHFTAAIELLPAGSPELMSAHTGAGYCLLKQNGDAAQIMEHVRAMRELDLRYEKAVQFRFKTFCQELVPFWGELLNSVRDQMGVNGVCGWCLQPNADKKCSACNAKEFCSVECFRLAWKGDDLFPAHKQSCKKK